MTITNLEIKETLISSLEMLACMLRCVCLKGINRNPGKNHDPKQQPPYSRRNVRSKCRSIVSFKCGTYQHS
ncbi:hypothetical protein THF1C08_50183 [Vibrio jasicida]|nr:hypothetical protein THF1C08_50183 [Vibrio jasicida]